jgi:ribonuclease P protein component
VAVRSSRLDEPRAVRGCRLQHLARVTISKSRGSIISRFAFGPNARLRKKSDIERCQKKGTKIYAKHFLLLVIPSDSGGSRLAVAVTVKLEGRAVVRNLIKRRIRHVFRESRGEFTQPIDIVVVARRDIQSCELVDYRNEILGALKAHGYLRAG